MTEAQAIDRSARDRSAPGPRERRDKHEPYDSLVAVPGAEPIRPPIPGVETRVSSRSGRPGYDRIARYIETRKPRHAVVVGGGFIGPSRWRRTSGTAACP